MKRVKHIIEGKEPAVLAVGADTTVYDAVAEMAEHDVGALVVLDGDRLEGIFSERDYARKVALRGKSSREMRVGEVMTPRVLCVRGDQTVDEAMALMVDKGVRHLPVIEGHRVVGVLSMRDAVGEVVSEQQFVIAQLENYIQRTY